MRGVGGFEVGKRVSVIAVLKSMVEVRTTTLPLTTG
jgi:hypothetical protein